jgi:hypothetical protein
MSSLTRQFAILVVTAIAIAAPARAQAPVDDWRVRQLESEVTRLQRALDAQSRRIEMLEQAARIAPPTTLPGAGPVPRPPNTSPAWLVAASWDRIKPGMKVAEVIAILGRPTSDRYSEEGKLRLMFYAMELAADAVLSGTIRVDDSGVVEINRPVLK